MIRSIQLENRVLFITCFLILLFAYTATSKLLDARHFQAVLLQSPLLARWADPLAYLVPATEWLITILLLLPSTRKGGLLGSAVLMLLFTAYVAYILLADQKLPCSCGGILQQLGWKTHLVFNALTMMAAFWSWRHSVPALRCQKVVVSYE